jgi:hypothetical protein
MVKKAQVVTVPVVPEVVVAPEAPKVDTGLELYGKLRNEINSGKVNFTEQLKQVKEAIAARTKEIENLRVQELKLQGAVEASDIFLKAVLPSNNIK